MMFVFPNIFIHDFQVYVEPQTHIIEKTKIRTHYKPHHHHVHKTAYISGYVGGGADISPPSYIPIQKRVDVGVQGSENVGVIDVGAHGHGGAKTTITKQVTVGQNPSFFADIFNVCKINEKVFFSVELKNVDTI